MANARFTRFALAAVGLCAVVVVLGAFTRLVDAGLGCPDWPGCYGFLTVPSSETSLQAAQARFPDAPVEAHKAWWEMIHRYFAGALGLVILGLAIAAVRGAMREPAGSAGRWPVGLAVGLVVLVACQAAFGAWTVTLKLWPQVVTVHLLGGFATLSLLWLLCLRLGVLERWTAPRALLPHGMLALAVVIVQIALGGWVSSNYAALACHDFPTCHGAWWPEMNLRDGFNIAQSVGPNYLGGQLESDARVAIQFFHRLGALVVLGVVGSLAWRLYRSGSALALPVAAVLGVQLLLGVLNVVLVLPLWSATAHNAVGALLLLSLVTVNYRAFREAAAPAPQPLPRTMAESS